MAREEKAESRDASEETEGERESVGVGYSCYIIHPAFVGDCGRGGGCGLTYALIRRFRSISDNGIGLSLSPYNSPSLSHSLHFTPVSTRDPRPQAWQDRSTCLSLGKEESKARQLEALLFRR